MRKSTLLILFLLSVTGGLSADDSETPTVYFSPDGAVAHTIESNMSLRQFRAHASRMWQELNHFFSARPQTRANADGLVNQYHEGILVPNVHAVVRSLLQELQRIRRAYPNSSYIPYPEDNVTLEEITQALENARQERTRAETTAQYFPRDAGALRALEGARNIVSDLHSLQLRFRGLAEAVSHANRMIQERLILEGYRARLPRCEEFALAVSH